MNARGGFTIAEILVAVGIAVLVGAVVIFTLIDESSPTQEALWDTGSSVISEDVETTISLKKTELKEDVITTISPNNTESSDVASQQALKKEAKEFGLSIIETYFNADCDVFYSAFSDSIYSFGNPDKPPVILKRDSAEKNKVCELFFLLADVVNGYDFQADYLNLYDPVVYNKAETIKFDEAYAQKAIDFRDQLRYGETGVTTQIDRTLYYRWGEDVLMHFKDENYFLFDGFVREEDELRLLDKKNLLDENTKNDSFLLDEKFFIFMIVKTNDGWKRTTE